MDMLTSSRLIVEAISRALARDLGSLADELRRLPDDAAAWAAPCGAANSVGTLAAHAAGNLLHFVGSALGATGYVRDRDAEFAVRGATRDELIGRLEEAGRVVAATLSGLDDAALAAPFPVAIASRRFTTGAALVHLATHLAYHLGQADVVRRALSADTGGVGAASPAALADLAS
jgi:uncharacterized damage-inducible protein DinB